MADIESFELDKISARAAVFSSFQIRNKKVGIRREKEQAPATRVHGRLKIYEREDENVVLKTQNRAE